MPQDSHTSYTQAQVTEMGNPAHPVGSFGNQMLDRMNDSHAEFTNWGLDQLDFSEATSALDVGCGGGATLERLLERMSPSARVYGVDISEVSVAHSLAYNRAAHERGQVEVLLSSAEDLPFDDKSFDVVVSVESIYFWPDTLAGLRECLRVLVPSGQLALICDVYEKPDLSHETRENIAHHNMVIHTPKDWEHLLTEAGFTDAHVLVVPDKNWICIMGKKEA